MTGQDLRTVTTMIRLIPLEQGDCLVFAEDQARTGIQPTQVPCEGEWTHRVVSSYEATDPNYYPSVKYFREQSFLHCSPNYSIHIRPLEPAWTTGERTVACLQDSFGLSLTDPEKLDRMIGPAHLTHSDCFNVPPESGGLQVEVVPCSDRWELRVLNTFETTDSPDYPGDLRLNQESIEKCDRRTTWPHIPEPLLWDAGYRTTQCLQENPTSQPGTPETLDRLVDIYRTAQGECFNSYETPSLFLAELTPCSSTWEYQVLLTHTFPPSIPYPGDAPILQNVTDRCGPEDIRRKLDQGDQRQLVLPRIASTKPLPNASGCLK